MKIYPERLEDLFKKRSISIMTSSRRLLQLSALVQDNTSAIDTYIENAGLPQPSFDPSGPMAWDLPPNIDAARNTALEALDELREHLLGPTQNIASRVVDVNHPISLFLVLLTDHIL
jgi:hypothetical protein